jgi:hypothetical protein
MAAVVIAQKSSAHVFRGRTKPIFHCNGQGDYAEIETIYRENQDWLSDTGNSRHRGLPEAIWLSPNADSRAMGTNLVA